MRRSCDVDCLTLFGAQKIMSLKLKFKSKDEIPAEHVSLYVERGGAFVLDAEDAVEKAKLDEEGVKLESGLCLCGNWESSVPQYRIFFH